MIISNIVVGEIVSLALVTASALFAVAALGVGLVRSQAGRPWIGPVAALSVLMALSGAAYWIQSTPLRHADDLRVYATGLVADSGDREVRLIDRYEWVNACPEPGTRSDGVTIASDVTFDENWETVERADGQSIFNEAVVVEMNKIATQLEADGWDVTRRVRSTPDDPTITQMWLGAAQGDDSIRVGASAGVGWITVSVFTSECLGDRRDRADSQDNEPTSRYATFEVVDEFVP